MWHDCGRCLKMLLSFMCSLNIFLPGPLTIALLIWALLLHANPTYAIHTFLVGLHKSFIIMSSMHYKASRNTVA